jgi:hypothetical protein
MSKISIMSRAIQVTKGPEKKAAIHLATIAPWFFAIQSPIFSLQTSAH